MGGREDIEFFSPKTGLFFTLGVSSSPQPGPVFPWGQTSLPFKQPDKIADIQNSHLFRHLGGGQIAPGEQRLGPPNPPQPQSTAEGHAGFSLEAGGQIAFADPCPLGQRAGGGISVQVQ